MIAESNLCGLPIGQLDEPAPDLVAAVAIAMSVPELVALADQLAEKSAELIRQAGAQQIMQSAVVSCLHTGDRPAAMLQLALDKMSIGIEIAKVELDRTERRLAEHRQSLP